VSGIALAEILWGRGRTVWCRRHIPGRLRASDQKKIVAVTVAE
jgi:hypothetical protein